MTERQGRFTLTIFGAESTGKTTLATELAGRLNGFLVPEWARGYLEDSGPDLNTDKMTEIWKNQLKAQHIGQVMPHGFVVQDTDLFSTVGFWNYWDGMTPKALVEDAIDSKSDLYLLTLSNIPFEPDQLRYGGDKRETSDQYWMDLLERYGLNYQVIGTRTIENRLTEALDIIEAELSK